MNQLARLFFIMLKIGALTFGGGLTMLGQMQIDFVEKQKWVTQEELTDIFALSQAMPGVIAVNAAYQIGYRVAGLTGALLACLGAILPSLLILAVVTVIYKQFISDPWVVGAMRGIRAAVTALLLSTAVKLRKTSVRSAFGWLLCAAATAAAILFPAVNVIWLILGGALLGLLTLAVGGRPKTGDSA